MGTFLDQTPGDPNEPIPVEPLGRAEAALVLGISPEAGAKRYFRILERLKDLRATMPGGGEGP
jgi:hypothetical protein